MAPVMEASSLSSITQLAGNPPRYPRNPTEQKRDSLVLYIARVPGSRDIILTTMKPRLKNVTAEDVVNCLYYLHADAPTDALLVEDSVDNGSSKLDMESVKTPVTRKPLIGDSQLGMPPAPPSLPKEVQGLRGESSGVQGRQKSPDHSPHHGIPNRKPLLPQRPPHESNRSPTRRPLGPRPLVAEAQMNRVLLPGNENIPFGMNLQLQRPAQGIERGRVPYQGKSGGKTYNEFRLLREASDYPPVTQTDFKSENFSITLIRRDPTSGAQWNIGQISSEPIEGSIVLPPPKQSVGRRPTSVVWVELTTLGYGQFRPPQIALSTDQGSLKTLALQNSASAQNGFNREVRMEWSKFWERKFKQHRRGSSDQSDTQKEAAARRHSETPTRQFQIEDQNRENLSTASSGVVESGFLSPWKGHCEFSTGSSGRTLKCKHTLPSPATISSSAPPFSGVSAQVSELRFNLPSVTTNKLSTTITGGSQDSVPFKSPKFHHIRSKLSSDNSNPTTAPKPSPTSYAAMYPSDDEDDTDDGLDLSLGREKAGGGIRGKRAKLGKLIVHDEGLKMLDLVIAANMGIWWTVWDP